MMSRRDALKFAVTGALGGGLGITVARTNISRTKSTGAALEGRFLVVTYVGAEFCAQSRSPTTAAYLREILERLRSSRQALGREIVARGVALDWSLEEGLKHLSRSGPWDEMVVGRNWANTQAVHWFWRQDLTPATPQVIIASLAVEVAEYLDSAGTLRKGLAVSDERLLRNFIGSDEIRRASRLGLSQLHSP
jgi:hypothetical protein